MHFGVYVIFLRHIFEHFFAMEEGERAFSGEMCLKDQEVSNAWELCPCSAERMELANTDAGRGSGT